MSIDSGVAKRKKNRERKKNALSCICKDYFKLTNSLRLSSSRPLGPKQARFLKVNWIKPRLFHCMSWLRRNRAYSIMDQNGIPSRLFIQSSCQILNELVVTNYTFESAAIDNNVFFTNNNNPKTIGQDTMFKLIEIDHVFGDHDYEKYQLYTYTVVSI